MNTISGLRTLIGVLFAMACLVAGLFLLAVEQRGAAYGAFSLAIVGVVGALAGKASVDALAAGGGVSGAKAALMTPAKPGDPPAPSPPPGSVETKTTTTVTP
jgi:uncharacterized membrane protein YeaQ/YmgE (transglycosylase-associated protein family)